MGEPGQDGRPGEIGDSGILQTADLRGQKGRPGPNGRPGIIFASLWKTRLIH